MRLPTVTIITIARNCESILKECYSRVSDLDYPKEKIEMILVDGESTDKTRETAAKFGARVIDGGYPDNQEARRNVGLKYAQNEILLYLDSDNYIPNSNWLRQMIQPFVEDQEIIATQTLRYGYHRDQSAINRYYALFGVNDPVAYYLKKMDRLSWAEKKWKLSGQIVEERKGYFKVKFSPDNFPTLGCNGFVIRKEILSKIDCSPEEFFHIDVLHDLAKMGYDIYGIVKNDIIHQTGETFFGSARKRLNYMRTHSQQLKEKRRYKVYDASSWKDNFRLVKFILYSLTVIKPTYDSIRGFLRKPDIAWFFHPLMCLSMVGVYGFASVGSFLKLHRIK